MARTPKVVEDRREQIIDAAMRVFAEKGFTRATNRDIAREAGITPGLIYHYFENKEAVFRAIIEARSPLHMLRTLPMEALAQPPEPLLRLLVLRVLDIVEGEKFVPLIHMLLPEVIHNPAISPIGTSLFQQVVDLLSKYLSSKMESGELRRTDSTRAAHVFISSMMGFVLRRQVLRDAEALALSHEQIADALVDIVLNGLLPR